MDSQILRARFTEILSVEHYALTDEEVEDLVDELVGEEVKLTMEDTFDIDDEDPDDVEPE